MGGRMTQFDARIDIDPTAAGIFRDVLVVAVHEASKVVEEKGHALTLNALMGAFCSVAAWHIAGVDDQRARKSLMRQMERELPKLVAHYRANGQGGGVVTIYEGAKTN